MRSKIWWSRFSGFFLAAVLAAPIPAHAFGFAGWGGKLGYISPESLEGTLTVGAHLEFAQSGSRLHLLPSVMYWNTNGLSDFSANGDLYYHFVHEGMVTPYVGAGLGLQWVDSDGSRGAETDLGANLFGGLKFPSPAASYFLEGRYTASDISQFAILGGITFNYWSAR